MPQSGYDIIANEYYDAGHVTSRNFDHTTIAALAQQPFPCVTGLVLELGAGRGRATEFLGVEQSRLIQLDSSEAMFALPNREPCALKILSDACKIPLVSEQFAFVVGFLVDPFMGLDCLGEAFRMLKDHGNLLLTVPTKLWGDAIRSELRIDSMTTRFRRLGTVQTVQLPSVLHSPHRIEEMLKMSGFRNISVTGHCLPPNEQTVSPDIMAAAGKLNVPVEQLEIINVVRAAR
jgi:SAM-dependent methyltransferase